METKRRLIPKLILSFDDPAFEARFVAQYTESYLLYARASLIGVGILVLVIFLVDLINFPGVKANYYRAIIFLPFMLAVILYTRTGHAKKHWPGVMAGLVFIASLCIFWILAMVGRQGGRGLESWIGIIDFTFFEFFCFVILGIPFRYALVSGTLIFGAFFLVVWFESGMGLGAFSYRAYHIAAIFLLAAGIGWWREFLIRQDFATKTALDEARRAAESLARAKSEFLANMSHEIRTPLNGVLGLAQIGYRESGGHASQETFNLILRSGKLLLAVVNDILDFSKMEAGKLKIETVSVEIGQVLEDAVAPVRERATAKAIALNVERAPDLPASCLGDPLRLTQILVNFLSNAVKFTEKGSVTLRAFREEGCLVFQVADTGIGMAPEQIEQIFAPFQQGDTSATRKFGGTGLGLAISRRLADLMGAEIRVASRAGAGSTFELRLPYVEAGTPFAAAQDGEAARLPPAGPRLSGISVLAAEDNEINQEVLLGFLHGEGAKVVSAANGREAVECVISAGRDAFDIVLMDIQMREMDGYEATRRILELAPEMPIVAMTAHAMADERQKSLAAGMRDHLTKPLSIDDLVATIIGCVSRRPPPLATEGSERLPNVARQGEREDDMAPIDWAGLEAKYADSPGYLARVIAGVLQTDADMPARLRQAAAAGDLAEVAFLAHAINNTALIVMAGGAYAQAGATELAAHSGEPQATSLAGYLAAAHEEVLNHLARRQSADAKRSLGVA